MAQVRMTRTDIITLSARLLKWIQPMYRMQSYSYIFVMAITVLLILERRWNFLEVSFNFNTVANQQDILLMIIPHMICVKLFLFLTKTMLA
jgi:hypothetical protein